VYGSDMGESEGEYECSESTTWAWIRVKVSPAPQAPGGQRRKAPSKRLRAPWNPRDPLTVLVRYRGGSECWYELRARGRTYRAPGHLAINDIMDRIYE
jgi:hypothetical protein